MAKLEALLWVICRDAFMVLVILQPIINECQSMYLKTDATWIMCQAIMLLL